MFVVLAPFVVAAVIAQFVQHLICYFFATRLIVIAPVVVAPQFVPILIAIVVFEWLGFDYCYFLIAILVVIVLLIVSF